MKSSTKWLLAAACGIAAVAVILLASLTAPGASVVEPAVTAGDDNSEAIVVSHPASESPSASPTPSTAAPSTSPSSTAPTTRSSSGATTTKPTRSATKAKPVQRTQTPVYNDDDDDDDDGGDDDGDD